MASKSLVEHTGGLRQGPDDAPSWRDMRRAVAGRALAGSYGSLRSYVESLYCVQSIWRYVREMVDIRQEVLAGSACRRDLRSSRYHLL
jgi:hypothetical protein